jgi:hypothetical protein
LSDQAISGFRRKSAFLIVPGRLLAELEIHDGDFILDFAHLFGAIAGLAGDLRVGGQGCTGNKGKS